MTSLFSKCLFRIILVAGIFVGILKGQEARQKWVSKKKMKYEAKRSFHKTPHVDPSLVALDDIEMSTYHS